MAGAVKIPEPAIRISLSATCRAHYRGRWFSTSPERGILPIYLPTTFRSHFAAKFSMQIVNNAMHIVCIPAGHFHCIHLFRTVGDSNPALIINYFRGENRACLRMFTNSLRAKNRMRFLLAGGANAQLSIYVLYTVVIVVNFVCHQLTSSLQELPIINMSHWGNFYRQELHP